MSTEAIITLIITLIVGILGFITLFKINQTKIVYLEKQIINLKDDLLKNFEDLSIKYKGIEVQKNIFFLSGFIVCQGKRDIQFDKNNNIEVFIPENSKWLDFKVVSNSRGMQIDSTFKDNKVALSLDLFKSKEYIEYEGIIEIDEKTQVKGINSLLDFHHRLPNIPNINKFNIETLKSGLGILIISCLLAILPILIIYDYHKIDSYDLNAFNSTSKKEISSYLIHTDENLKKLQNNVIEEYSGFKILLDGKTEDFPIEIIKFDGTKDKSLTSVYFKLDNWGVMGWIFAIFLILILALAIIGILTSIRLFYFQKRYLNLIKK